MRELLITSFIVFNLGLSGQNLFPEKFTDCDSKAFFLEGKEIYTENLNENLISDLVETISEETSTKIKGEIMIQIYIDTIGTPCCISIKNDLNSKGKTLEFKHFIDSQTKWSPPIREGEKSSVSSILKITFTKDKIILKRLGFNMKSGLVELKSMEMKKE